MSTVLKILLITLCMNICLSIAGISMGGFDSLSSFISIDNETISPTNQFSLTGNNTAIPTSADDAVTDVSTSDNTFIDTIRLTFNFIKLILVSLFFPLYWGFVLGFPLWLNLLLVVQTIAGIASVVLVLRGVGS